VRLLTLTGAAGSGKTRLALQGAAAVIESFADGVFLVTLEAVADPALVLPAVAQTLGVAESGPRPLAQALDEFLRAKQALLVLDNVEHLLEAAPLLNDLLLAAPSVKLLVTSRAALRLTAEHEYPVPALSLPDPARLPELASLSQYESVALFLDRARAVRPDFDVTVENAPAIAEICVRLDGLPLAIELAAARVRILTPQAMLMRLGQRLALLTGGARDLPSRQRTLRSAIDWSYEQLEESEQRLLARLSVFARRRLRAGGGRGRLRRDPRRARGADRREPAPPGGAVGRAAAVLAPRDDSRVRRGAARGARRGGSGSAQPCGAPPVLGGGETRRAAEGPPDHAVPAGGRRV